MRVVAALTDRRGLSAVLSPFFEMAPWVLLVRPNRVPRRLWVRNQRRDRRWLRRMLLDADVEVVVCGWIDAESLEMLMMRGVSVVVGPCDVPALGLVADAAARKPTVFATFETLGPDT